jgi:hypothetical protein
MAMPAWPLDACCSELQLLIGLHSWCKIVVEMMMPLLEAVSVLLDSYHKTLVRHWPQHPSTVACSRLCMVLHNNAEVRCRAPPTDEARRCCNVQILEPLAQPLLHHLVDYKGCTTGAPRMP